jgi:hypothetical protein
MFLALPLIAFQNCSEQNFTAIESKVGGLGEGPDASLTINSGATYATTRAVVLSFRYQEVSEVVVANDACPAPTGSFSPILETSNWTLGERDGLSRVFARFKSSKGEDIGCREAAIVLDRVAPRLSIESTFTQYSNQSQGDFEVAVEELTSGLRSLECRLPGATVFERCQTVFGVENLTEGSQTLAVRASDRAGNTSDVLEYSFLTDYTAPSVRILEPSAGVTVITDQVVARFEVDDGGGSGVEKSECWIDTIKLASCQSPLALEQLTDGRHVFAVVATDKAGNASPRAEVAFNVDTRPSGEFRILGVRDETVDQNIDTYLTGPDGVQVHWSRSDGAQNYRVSILSDSKETVVCGEVTVPAGMAATQFHRYTNAQCSLAENTYYWARASALRGTAVTLAPDFRFLVDRRGPVIQIGNIAVDDERKTAQVNFTVTDGGSGVDRATCYKQFGTDVRQDVCTGLLRTDYAQVPNGDHDFYVIAADRAGNMTRSDTRRFTMRDVVCNPFATTTPIGPNVVGSCRKGLRANLYYASAEDRLLDNGALGRKFNSVDKLITLGLRSRALLYLPSLDVRARKFQNGFTTTEGQTLRDDSGATLVEWFALDMESILKLAPGETAGRYHIIVVSDDGVLFDVKNQGDAGLRNLISHDGLRAPSVGCPTNGEALQLDSASRLPIRIRYYQGPREDIAISVFWKKVDASTPANNLAALKCGQQRTSDFYSATPGAVPVGYQALFDLGYRPLQEGNFILNETVQ